MSIPIIRIELEGMKHTLMAAMSQHLLEMDDLIQVQVDRVCTPENISSIVYEQAKTQIKNAIDDAVRTFYSYGDGQKAVKEAVFQALKESRKNHNTQDQS